MFKKGLIFGRLRQILHRFSGSGSVLCRLAQSAGRYLPKAKRKMSSSMNPDRVLNPVGVTFYFWAPTANFPLLSQRTNLCFDHKGKKIFAEGATHN
jgi:hypothetical protein